MTTSDFTSEARELAARTGDGIDVRLFWHPSSDTVTVSMFDATYGRAFEIAVDPEEALDAFQHPFAYAAFRGAMNGWAVRFRATVSFSARADAVVFASAPDDNEA